MKLELKFNIWMFAIVVCTCLTLLLALIIAVQNAQEYYAYQKYISDNTKTNIEWYYNCDTGFYGQFYNCPNPKKNLTGLYCEKELICENSYKIK